MTPTVDTHAQLIAPARDMIQCGHALWARSVASLAFIPHKDKYGLRFGGGNKEGEGICLVNQSDEQKVLRSALLGNFAKLLASSIIVRTPVSASKSPTSLPSSAPDHGKETTQTPRA
jgi:hypothetical protein